jgi:hypothetical protein
MKKYNVTQFLSVGRNDVYVAADFVEVVDDVLQFGTFDSPSEPNIVVMFKDWSHFSEIPCNGV